MEQQFCAAESTLGGVLPVLEASETFGAHEPPAFDIHALEPVMLNLEHAVKVQGKHQFFGWTQGLLQSLVPHELLVCALRNGSDTSYNVDCFSVAPGEPARFSDLLRREVAVLPGLVSAWEKNSFFPVSLSCAAEAAGGGSFWRELQRIGVQTITVHGTHDVARRTQSLFIFACRPGSADDGRDYSLQLVIPSLHAAWVRTQINPSSDSSAPAASASGGLTGREHEVLRWVYLGKSNYEIGMILSISPLTVKNHVQKILRKLNVQNRTQAVGKAMQMGVLSV
jgi:transcriptional regulator EpsA